MTTGRANTPVTSGAEATGNWLALAVLALVVRLVAAAALDAFRHPELFEYEALARAMLAGDGFTYHHLGVVYHSYAPPLYSWICAAIYLVGGSPATVLIVQMLAGAALAVLVALLAERLFGSRPAGLAAGLLMVVHPGLVIYAGTKLHPLTFDALFFTLALWQCWRFADRPTVERAAVLGLVVGVGALTRATIVVFLPLACVWSVWAARRISWATARNWVVAAVCAGAVILPWTVRNTVINGEFVWMVSVDGEVLWRGNNEYATGHSYLTPDRLILDTLTPTEQSELRSLPSETAQSQWFRARAWDFIKVDPGRFIRVTLTKLGRFWWFGPQTGVLYPEWWLTAYMVFYLFVLALAAVGAWSVAASGDHGARARLILILLFSLALSGLQSLYYVETRHRWAIEPLLLLIAGGGAAASVRWLQRTPGSKV